MVEFLYSFYLLINIVRLNFALPAFETCIRGCFSVFTRRTAGHLMSENGETDRKQTQKEADKNT